MTILDWFHTFERGVEDFDRSSVAEQMALAQDELASVLERYPRDGWKQMAVEDYAQGAGGESFTSWMEHNSRNICQMPARHAGIHLIYKEGGERWRYPAGYSDVHDAWRAVRDGYVRAFDLAEADRPADIDSLEVFNPGRLTLSKSLHVYFPDRYLPITAKSHLDHFLRRVLRQGWDKDTHGKMGPAELSRTLLCALRAEPGLAGWSTGELMMLLYTWADPRAAPSQVVRVPPGEDGRFWADCREGGYVCVGWDALGDLRKITRQSQLRREMTNHYGATLYNNNASKITKKSRELWQFRHTNPGAVLVANKGTAQVLGVGRVQEPGYRWRADRSEYKNTLDVEWDATLSGEVPKQGYWAFETVQVLEPQTWDVVFGPLVEGAAPPIKTQPVDRPPQVWLFQCNPKYYDLEGALDGLTGTDWRATRYAKEMQPGDKVYIWVSGKKGGIRALATIRSAAHDPTGAHDPYSLSKDPGSGTSPMVDLEWDQALPRGPGRKELKAHPVLSNLGVLRQPQETNYRVSAEEDEALMKLLQTTEVVDEAVSFDAVMEALDDEGLTFPEEVVANLILALQTKRFAILTGISGTGKTQIALTLARLFGIPDPSWTPPAHDPDARPALRNLAVVAVRPDWTDNRGLLGYLNPLTEQYATTPFLRLLLEARREADEAAVAGRPLRPFFAILDEMNLARVEHYFSDFLSALESEEALELHQSPTVTDVPKQLAIPSNLFFVGTVNVDETTYMFSPKVLDRAFTIEFNDVDLVGEGAASSPLRLDKWEGRLRFEALPRREHWVALGKAHEAERDHVLALHKKLTGDNRHFGYRVANEMARFVLLAVEQASDHQAADAALDLAILQKVLPKLHGTRQELSELLDLLLAFAADVELDAVGNVSWHAEQKLHLKGGTLKPRFPRTATKLCRMRRKLERQGFTSFVE